MIRVLLVDDEPLSLSLMSKVIDWGRFGMRVVGTAYNGENALEFLQRESVDIVFTDIKMPHMDGIELVKRVKEFMPHIQFVMISSYSDFALVKESFQYGITDYILKVDIDNEDVILPLLEKLQQKACFQSAHPQESTMEERVFSKLPVSLAQREQHCYRLLQIQFEEPVKPLYITECLHALGQQTRDFCYVLFERQILVLVFSDNGDAVREKSHFLAQGILTHLGEKLESSQCCIGCSSVLPYSRRGDLFDQAKQAADYRFYYPKYYYFEYQNPADKSYLSLLAKIQKQMNQKNYQIHVEGLSSNFVELFKEAKNSLIAPQKLMADIKTCWQLFADQNESTPLADFATHFIGSMSDLQKQVLEWNEQLFSQNSQAIPAKNNVDSYLEINYSDPELSLSKMAADLHINKRQLSVYFAQEKQTNFKHYLNQIRIRHACELLQYTFLRVNEVSEKVGYLHVEHFSRVFTSMVGVPPATFSKKNFT